MTDDNLRQLLRRYEPAGPPPDLRARVLAGPAGSGRAWPWLVAAAALLVLTIGLHQASPRPGSTTADDARAAEIAELVGVLGGGEEARVVAERVVAERELRRTLEDRLVPVGTPGEGR